ncbi:hypothetical protein IAD21_03207 [Abditibacteriota bacterium]|nr:hypothetical protein IAD21_03207 [Abditibacteriota bacterium]
MLSSHPLFRRFENELTVGEQKLEWTVQANDFVFRPQDADESIVWFLLRRANLRGFLLSQCNAANIDDNRAKIENIVLGRQFWRWWQLPSGEECFLRKNYGIFRAPNGEFVRFDFPAVPGNIGRMAGEDIEQFLKKLSTPGSDLETAREWLKVSVQERVRQLLVLRGGDFGELEALIRGALILSGVPETKFAMRDVMIMPGRILLQYEAPRYETGYAHPVDVFFVILNRYFHLERTAQEWRGHDEFGDPADVPYPIYTASQPNQHERLEALLVWRDFLRGKLPSEEIEKLLPRF